MAVRPFVAAAALCLLAACDDAAFSVVCPSDPAPAVAIAVLDEAGGVSLAAQARGSYTVGARSDTLRFTASVFGEALMAAGPAGSYRLEVLVPGRAPWQADGVQVRDGACGPATVHLVATPALLD